MSFANFISLIIYLGSTIASFLYYFNPIFETFTAVFNPLVPGHLNAMISVLNLKKKANS